MRIVDKVDVESPAGLLLCLLTYPFIFTESDQSEAHCEHAGMYCKRYGFCAVLELCVLSSRQGRGHE